MINYWCLNRLWGDLLELEAYIKSINDVFMLDGEVPEHLFLVKHPTLASSTSLNGISGSILGTKLVGLF